MSSFFIHSAFLWCHSFVFGKFWFKISLHREFSWSVSDPPIIFRVSASNLTTITSFQIPSNSLIILPFHAGFPELWTCLLTNRKYVNQWTNPFVLFLSPVGVLAMCVCFVNVRVFWQLCWCLVMCGCFDNCVGVLVICVLVFTVFFIICTVCFVLFRICTGVLISP